MMNNLIIRVPGSEDREGVARVDASATAALRRVYRPKPEALKKKEKISGASERLVAVLGHDVAGMVDYYIEGTVLHLYSLGVSEDHRGRGIARALVEHLAEIGRMAGATELILFTIRETGNVSIFEKLGFEVVSEEPAEYFESDRFAQLLDVKMIRSL